MSHAPAWEPSYPPTVQDSHHDGHSDEDVKAPYDDLIDQYATPFRQNSRHKVHKVDPLAFDQKTDPSGKDLEEASSNGHDWAYPPPTATTTTEEKGKGKALTWSAVRLDTPFFGARPEPNGVAAHPRLYCMSTIPLDCSCRDCNRFGDRGRPADSLARL